LWITFLIVKFKILITVKTQEENYVFKTIK